MSQNLQNFVKFQKFQLENLVDFEKCCQTHIYLQKSEPIQPKTSNILPKICRSAVVLLSAALERGDALDRIAHLEKNPGALKAALAAPVLKDGEATLRKSGLRIEYKLRAFVGKSWPKSNTMFAILHIHIFEFFFSSSTFQKVAIVK